MKRLHLFEFEDKPWLPRLFRNFLTEGLHTILAKFQVYAPIIPILKNALEHMETMRIVDLASGSGGPWPELQNQLSKEGLYVTVTLTDKYPNIKALKQLSEMSESKVNFVADSVDALKVPVHLKGVRTMFTGFHHFPPEMAQGILQNAVDNREAIVIAEFTERSLRNLILAPLRTIPMTLFYIVPVITRPLTLPILFWTYIIPLIPLIVFWDGFVSVLRTYTIKEMKAMTSSIISADNYEWKVGKATSRITGIQNTILYLVGYPDKY